MKTLKILILEDNQNDVELIKSELTSHLDYDFHFLCVVTRKDFIAAIKTFSPDIVLSDYNLPQFNGLDALKITINANPVLPFLIVTGTLTEESAADSIKAGSWDYIVKERLYRLPQAVKNVLKLKSEILKARKAEFELKLIKENSHIQIKLLYDAINHAPSSVIITDKDGIILFVNPKFEEVTGYKSEEAVGQNPRIMKSGKHDKIFYQTLWDTILKGKEWKGEMINKKKNGELYWEQVSISPILNDTGEIMHFVALKHDITKAKEHEEQLQKSENWYKSIFEYTGTAACILDANMIILMVNSKFVEISGFTKEELEGKKSWLDFLIKEELDKILGYHKERRNPGKHPPSQYECNFINKKGKISNVLLSVGLIKGTDKSVVSLLDTTQQKKILEELKASEEKFRLISTSAQDGIIMINQRGQVIYWNPAAEKIFGYTSEEAQLCDVHKLISPPNYHQQQNFAFEHFKFHGEGSALGNTLELKAVRKDGSLFEIELSLAGMHLPDGYGAVGLIRDITERKRVETELIYAKEKAEESDRLKSAFLATMSHELRTPLNAVIGFSGLIDKNLPLQDIEEMAKMINSSGKHLLKIIESIFEISFLETQDLKLNIEEFSLFEFLGSMKTFLKNEMITKGKEHILLSFLPQENTSGLQLKTDKSRMSKLLMNLFNNAVKFTEAGSIEYGFTILNSDITFFVRDTGIGIPEDQTDIIFERFRQVDDTHTRKHGGVGLGLSISKEIARLLGGTLWVESEFGKGSTFYFKLPNAVTIKSDPAPEIPEKSSLIDLTGSTILVVEDEPYNYIFLETILSALNAKILQAQNGIEAIEMCKAHKEITLVLMDIKMPVMSGDEATRQIKAFRKDLPIIAQTAYANKPEIEKYMAMGFDDYITKPIKKEILLEKIYKNIKTHT
ncbi:MAG: PAS domain S-box protein [Bacteroidales bacterium]|nr:PAS domain S-box protein [Bacteroidales bacterium]